MSQSSGSNPTRLVHSNPGLLRASQMHSSECVAYVEGTDADLYYYAAVLRTTVEELGVEIAFRKSLDIAGVGEGKPRCLEYFRYLLASDRLVSNLDGKWTVNIFFVDKDIDDIEGLFVTSPYVCYTTHCCVENHIVRESNAMDAVAAVVSVPTEAVERAVGPSNDWLTSCCVNWREWIAICILAKTLGVPTKNYSRKSQVQENSDDPESPADLQKVSAYLINIERAAALSQFQWQERKNDVQGRLNTLGARPSNGHVCMTES